MKKFISIALSIAIFASMSVMPSFAEESGLNQTNKAVEDNLKAKADDVLQLDDSNRSEVDEAFKQIEREEKNVRVNRIYFWL